MKRFLLLLLLLSCTTSTPTVSFDNVKFSVELAKTPAEHEKGLMFRDSLPDDKGMLFVFEDEAPRSFWMKNTLISLDMVFLDKGMGVVDVKHNVPPCKEDPCPSYNSSAPAMYVLEINSGLAQKYKITAGSSSK